MKNYIKAFYVILLLLQMIMTTSCEDVTVLSLNGFSKLSNLVVKDSIVLEEKDILNPHYVCYKDSFLVFNSLNGRREIQLLDLKTEIVTEFEVIGLGRNEMQNYHSMNSSLKNVYMFADNRLGRVYGICLDSLRVNGKTDYDLFLSLPLEENSHFYRFMETPNYIIGIGMLKGGRFGVFKKNANCYKEQMEYPVNEDIEKMDYRYRGALYSRTMMASNNNGKRMVAACFGLVDFYSITDSGDMNLEKSNHYHFPQFKMRTTGPMITYSKEDKVGIMGLCADERFVYALYSDKTFKEYGEKAYSATYLLVWNWDGEHVRAYKLPVDLYCFTMNGDTIYGLSRDSSPIVYVLELHKMDNWEDEN